MTPEEFATNNLRVLEVDDVGCGSPGWLIIAFGVPVGSHSASGLAAQEYRELHEGICKAFDKATNGKCCEKPPAPPFQTESSR